MLNTLGADTTAVLDALPDAAVVVNREGTVVFANRQAGALLAAAMAPLAGTELERWLPAQTGTRGDARRADGTRFPVEVRRAPLGDPAGGLSLVTIRDRSEYAQLADAARDAEDRYRMVVTSASEVFYRVRMAQDSLRGMVEFVSPQCERLTGRPPADFLQNPALWIECIHPDDRAVLFQTTQEILQGGREGSRYYRIRNTASGEYRWVADRVVPLFDEHGHVTGYQGVARESPIAAGRSRTGSGSPRSCARRRRWRRSAAWRAAWRTTSTTW